jgi:short-subunit dehydrogenase
LRASAPDGVMDGDDGHYKDSKGFKVLEPDYVAREIVKGIDEGKREVYVSENYWFYHIVWRFFPDVIEKAARRKYGF